MIKPSLALVLLLTISQNVWAESKVSFSQEELATLSPFDPETQKRVLDDVLKIMGFTLNPDLEVPEVRVSESVEAEESDILEAAESQGMPGWALAKGVNMYLFRLNLIVVGEEMKLHNLAHEYAHYVQMKYKKYKVEDFGFDHVEFEAVEVQRNFRP